MKQGKLSPRAGMVFAAITLALCAWGLVDASDHSDAPVGLSGPRPDANLTDLHAFLNGQNLVLALSTNPTIPTTATSYVFPTDVQFDIHIDNDVPVTADSSHPDGGTFPEPEFIREDITFRIRFRSDGSAFIQRLDRGRVSTDARLTGFFAGLRDDPFIRGPRLGRNVASIVLELPLSSVLANQSALVIWATSRVQTFEGKFQELAGRSLKSMFPENSMMNALHPRLHFYALNKTPDVMIFDTSRPAAYPNGRALSDDVVDLVGDNRVLANDAPFPSANDKPFLATFPYLAQPHPLP
jgi:hypothetical protein